MSKYDKVFGPQTEEQAKAISNSWAICERHNKPYSQHTDAERREDGGAPTFNNY